MRIIVATACNTGDAEYKNMGDVAMLQVAVSRLLDLWPDAIIEVLTDSPANLSRYCPCATPLPRTGCMCWVSDQILLGQYHTVLPEVVSKIASTLTSDLRRRSPTLLKLLINVRLKLRDTDGKRANLEVFLDALNSADLFIVAGCGGFADSCRDWNLSILNTIEAAIEQGVPVAMFGQGMGPLKDHEVRALAARILPRVTLMSLRGSRDGFALLQAMGAPQNVLTTGDEAVELAYAARLKEPGNALGVNLRAAAYAGVGLDIVANVGSVIQEFARRHQSPLLPLPIAFHEYARDHETARQLMPDFINDSGGGLLLDTPIQVINRIARCRIVVSGAYHAAVFALAQGIPVVCLSNSLYYLSKFQGLQDLFGEGCAVVSLDDTDFPNKLRSEMDAAWNIAEAVRGSLLRSASSQVAASRNAYSLVKEMIGSRQAMPQPVLSEV